jgi:hypothetical protein
MRGVPHMTEPRLLVRTERPVGINIGTAWTAVEVVSEPFLVATFRGYAPMCEVQVVSTGLRYGLLIGSKSITSALEPLRVSNGGQFVGLHLSLRRTGTERTAPYEVRRLGD